MEETTPGVQCIAAPIFGPQGTVIASISISTMSQLVDEIRLARIIAAVRDAAQRLSRMLGYRGGGGGLGHGRQTAAMAEPRT